MGNMMKKKNGAQVAPMQGGVSPPYQQQQQQQQPQYMQQPQYVQQPQYMQQPQYIQQPQYMQQPAQYPSSYYSGASSPYNQNSQLLSSLTGWSSPDLQRLQSEFLAYANPNGIVDRSGFRRLYISSLLNTSWENIERNAEATFRSLDINQTGGLDFNEYMIGCTRMSGSGGGY
ncbi:unnamed protein product [Adineta steineri]|uniref:EF-hand domain-containing protein n=1 Tax=Adineta steineri TaxID=433720 RepID=A0A818HB15_9BILA|nr:unnamed protein product [Adineta steineri]CAF3501965.1 unnamed protein product [Adineta steineri]